MKGVILNNKFSIGLFIFICGIAFFWQDMYYYPGADDIFYKFKLDNPDVDFPQQLLLYPHQEITSWWDIIQSQNIHYICHSGRYLVHVLVQACTSFLSRPEFVFVNSLVFCCFVYFLGILSNKKNVGKGILLSTMTMLIFGTDVVNTIFCQIAVAINYMWTATAMMAFMVIYERVIEEEKKYSFIWQLLFFVMSVIVASLHEGFSIGFGAGLFFNTLLRIKKVKLVEAVMLFGFIIGSCICIFSPGNFGAGGSPGLFIGASHLLFDMMSYWVFWASVLTLIIYLISSREKTLLFLKSNIVYVSVVIVNLLFAFVIAYTHLRQLFPVTLSLVILMCRIWQTPFVRIPPKIQYAFVIIGAIYCTTIYISMTQLRKSVFEGHSDVIHQLMDTNSRILISDKHDAAVEKCSKIWFGRKYINIDGLNYYNSFSLLKTNGKDPSYVEAIIPMDVDDLIVRFNHEKNDEDFAHIRGGIYLYKSSQKVVPNKVKWNIVTVKYNPNHMWDEIIPAQYRIEYHEDFYYIFNGPSKIIESKAISLEGKECT